MTLKTRVCLGALLITTLLPLLTRDASGAAEEGAIPRKWALIVAVAEYAPETGWQKIHSDRDVPLIRTALESHEFTEIRELLGPAATRQGIVDAVRQLPVDKGDIVVFHYSGHGQQITDDEDEELDGYDESLVPYDAPADLKATPGYDGSKHLRDDDFNLLMQELRAKVKSTGNVIAFIDSCFSGTPRGEAPGGAGVRGGSALGKPRQGHRGGAEGTGLLETTRGGPASAPEGLAPYVVLSAARHDQFAWETRDENGDPVGSLSYALSLELADLQPEMKTYRDLFQGVSLQVAYRVRNEPQIEGDVDRTIFSGHAVAQEPFLRVKEVLGPDRVKVGAGTLAGLLIGSRAEVHPNGSREAADATLLAKAEVVESGPATAILKLDRSLEADLLHSSRVFITEHSFGALRVPVRLECLSEDVRAMLKTTLEKVASVALAKGDAEVVIRQQREPPYAIEVRIAADEFPLLESLLPTERDFANQIGDRLVDYSRNRYLRGLKIEEGALDVRLEMVPVKVEGCDPEVDPAACQVTPLSPELKRTLGGQVEWRSEDYFQLRVENKSTIPVHLTVLALGADGTLARLWPEHSDDKTSLAANTPSTKLQRFYQLSEYGRRSSEMFLLIATKDHFDFEPFITRGTPKGPMGPFAPLFDDDAIRGKVKTFYPEKLVGTSAVTFIVCPPEGKPCPPFGELSDAAD